MDFGALPPEINSARMYTGPGSAPLLAAASAWDGLAAELAASAADYQISLAELQGGVWSGPAAAAMSAAVLPYITWMSRTATLAEEAATQARAAAAAFEGAFSVTVPPAMVTANRELVRTLIATNVLGQNTPAIAAAEAHYGSMWAQDAAAMYGYAAQASAATRVTPFAAPAQATDSTGQDSQAALGDMAKLTSSTPDALQNLSSPAQASLPDDFWGDPNSWPFYFGDDGGAGVNLNSQMWNTLAATGIFDWGSSLEGLSGVGMLAYVMGNAAAMGGASLARSGAASAAGGLLASSVGSELGAAGLASGSAGAAGSVSAGVGKGTLVGSLSAPSSWTSSAMSVAPAHSLGTTVPSAAVAAGPAVGGPGIAGVPAAGARAGRGSAAVPPRYGFRPTVMARPVVGG